MEVVSLVALAANGACLHLLTRRHDDINMSSVWECSRNDIAANILVFLAALGVWLTGSGWPDIAVALILALLFLRSAASVIRGARAELEAAKAARAPLARPVTLSPITVRRRRPG